MFEPSKVKLTQFVDLQLIVRIHSSKLNLQNFHMTQYLVFRKLDWRSWKTSSKTSNLYSSIQFHFLFRTVKTAGPHLIPIKSYSKNTHPSSFLKWIIVLCCYLPFEPLKRISDAITRADNFVIFLYSQRIPTHLLVDLDLSNECSSMSHTCELEQKIW